MRRNDNEKDETFALEVLRDCEYATLATISPDGLPYCIPFSPVCVQRKIYFHCALEGMKLANISNNNKVCVSGVGYTKLVPEKYTTEFESAVATGICTLVTDEDEKIMALKLICEKYAASNMENFADAIAHSLSKTAVCKIEIEQISGKAKQNRK